MKNRTATCDDLNAVDTLLVERAAEVDRFLDFHDNRVVCPFYTSVDIRRNAYKAAVVDANAFPAGFNNLPRRAHKPAVDVARGYLGRNYPKAKEILLYAEGHTRNLPYFDSLRTLQGILTDAGYHVTVGTPSSEIADGTTLQAPGGSVKVHQIERQGDKLRAGGRTPDVVLLNNDLSGGVPELLAGITQPVNPPISMGWHRRRKSEHFAIVAQLASQLGTHLGFDPWLISAEFERVDGLDFKARTNFLTLATKVDAVIARTQSKYDEHGIKREASVFVKADAGTYGMAITTATSGADLIEGLNSRGREQMDRGKGKTKTTSVIVQETVPSDIRGGSGWVAEPVIYMLCSKTVGGFHRTHESKGDADNLNSPGSKFEPLAFLTETDGSAGPDEIVLDSCSAHVYNVLGRISSLATGYEAKFVDAPGQVPAYR